MIRSKQCWDGQGAIVMDTDVFKILRECLLIPVFMHMYIHLYTKLKHANKDCKAFWEECLRKQTPQLCLKTSVSCLPTQHFKVS